MSASKRSRSTQRTEGQLWDALAARLDAPSAPAEPTGDDLLRYAADPLAFVREVLGAEPWEAQQRILLSVRDHPRTTVRSSHGVGKTWTAACTALWWIYSHRPSLMISTAPTARQVESLLWAEINRLWTGSGRVGAGLVPARPGPGQAQGLPLPGRCLRTRLEASPTQTGMGLTTTEPERFAGWHSEHLLVIVDEASGVPDSLFEVLQGTLTSAHCRLLLIGNPTRSDGYFHRSHHTGDWHRLKISAYDTPNFGFRILDFGLPAKTDEPETSVPLTLSDPIQNPKSKFQNIPCPWLVTPEWVAARREEWGEDSDPFRVRVLGEFPRASSDALIRLEWIEAAEERGQRLTGEGVTGERVSDEPTSNERCAVDFPGSPSHPLTPSPPHEAVLGVDVARYGDCETVAALRRGSVLVSVWAWQGADLMHTCGRIVDLVREHRPGRLVIDAVGLGAGVVDRLREIQREGGLLQGCAIEAFQGGSAPIDPEKHDSRRDEAYLALSHRLRTGDIAFAERWSTLTGQLCSLKYGFTSRGQLKVESKDDRRRRGEPSPDWADAVALAFAPGPPMPFLPIAIGSRRTVELPMPPLRF